MSEFCDCKDPFNHDHTCIFSGYIPKNQITDEQKEKAEKNNKAFMEMIKKEKKEKLQLTNSYLKEKDFGERE